MDPHRLNITDLENEIGKIFLFDIKLKMSVKSQTYS